MRLLFHHGILILLKLLITQLKAIEKVSGKTFRTTVKLNVEEELSKNSIIYKIFLNNQCSDYLENTSNKRMVIDFIAGMTDDLFLNEIKRIWNNNGYRITLLDVNSDVIFVFCHILQNEQNILVLS